eukprot:538979-Pelagomonas_calceolata.AAC.1
MSPLHHKATGKKVLMGIWRVIGSIRFKNLAARRICVFNSAPSGNKLVSVLNQMGMKLVSKFKKKKKSLRQPRGRVH